MKNSGDIVAGLDATKLYRVSMDGPKVNITFLKELNATREQDLNHKLIDIGICSLHCIHGAFKTGEKKSEFGVSTVLKGSYYLLHDTPARREDYESVTGSSTFPLSFCNIRWVENKKAGVRLLDIWPNIVKVVKWWKDTLTSSRLPSSNSYKNVCVGVDEPLLEAKVKFFCYVADIIESYLKKYQTDKPMVPYMYDDLHFMMNNLFSIIVKPEMLEKCKSGKQLVEIDLSDEKKTLLLANKIQVGFAVEEEIDRLKKKDLVSISQTAAFMKMCKTYTIAMLEKL